MNRNLVLGIAAGAAAIVIISVISKRTGLLDSLMGKIRDLADAVEDKFDEIERKGMNDILPKGEDKNITSQMPHHN
jgi:hypothetical protein